MYAGIYLCKRQLRNWNYVSRYSTRMFQKIIIVINKYMMQKAAKKKRKRNCKSEYRARICAGGAKVSF